MEDVIVVGAGITGCIIARKLADAGYWVTLYDGNSRAGGACSDIYAPETGVYHQNHGSHIFHTNDEEVYNYLSQFTQWLPYQHKVKALVNGNLIPVPYNLNSLEQDIALDSGIKQEIFNALDLEKVPYGSTFILKELLNSEKSAFRFLGDYIKKTIFEYYSLKQWGEVPSDKVIERVAAFRCSRDDRYFLDKFQGIPDKGFTKMLEAIINRPNIKVLTRESFYLAKDTKDFIFYTGSIDDLLDYKFGPLPYRTCKFTNVGCRAIKSQELAVINYTTNYDFTRSHDYSHYMPGFESYITLEHSSDWSKDLSITPRYYPIDSEQSKRMYEAYKKELEEQHPNIILAGRLGTYKYLNMDQAVRQAMDIVKDFLT